MRGREHLGLLGGVILSLWAASAAVGQGIPGQQLQELRLDPQSEHHAEASPNPQPVVVRILRVDPVEAGLVLRPFWGDPLVGVMQLEDGADRFGAEAAINAGFFNRNTQQPIGGIRLGGRWLSNPVLGRGAVAWDDTGSFHFGRVQLRGEIANQLGDRVSLVGLNTAYILPGLSVITPDWGSLYTAQTDDEWVLGVRGDEVVSIQVGQEAGEMSMGIPVDGYLVVGRGEEGIPQAQRFRVGDRLQVSWQLDPLAWESLPHLLSAGPLLIEDGQVVLDAELERFQPSFINQRAARSAIGLTADGIVLFVVAGQAQESSGITLGQLAELMQSLGAVQALNLDGGNSSTLYWQGQVVNLPQPDEQGRIPWRPRIHNGLGWFRP